MVIVVVIVVHNHNLKEIKQAFKLLTDSLKAELASRLLLFLTKFY